MDVRTCRVLHERYQRCLSGTIANVLLAPDDSPKVVCAAAFADLRRLCHEHYRDGTLLRDAPQPPAR